VPKLLETERTLSGFAKLLLKHTATLSPGGIPLVFKHGAETAGVDV